MSTFPHMGVIPASLLKTIDSRTGIHNQTVSKLKAWIRISSAVRTGNHKGLILESLPSAPSFEKSYGSAAGHHSGKIGDDFDHNPIFAENDRIHRPSPTIDSLSVSYEGFGLSRKIKFSVICYTIKQANLLAEYLYNPGNALLVEFGWNTKNSLNQKSKVDICYMVNFNNYGYINAKRKAADGEYDGMLGMVTGGGFRNGSDDTYIIDAEVTSLGELPTYLQIHKNTGVAAGQTYEISQLKAYAGATKSKSIGKFLFRTMYNKLPAAKRTDNIKKLEYSGTDVNGRSWSDEINFINIDPDIQKSLTDDLQSGNTVKTKSGNVKIPEGINVFSNQSFIRLELAFKILESFSINLNSQTIKGCHHTKRSNKKTQNFKINTTNTILRAHKYMFSTNSNILYIPNTNHPSFNLGKILNATTELPSANISTIFDSDNSIRINTTNNCIALDVNNYAFPSVLSLTESNNTTSNKQIKFNITGAPDDARDIIADKYEWGYLRNLYINLDYFIEAIDRPAVVAKDVYLDILNGISSAVNSYWEFQLLNTSDGSNQYQVQAIDTTFSGNHKKLKKQTNITKAIKSNYIPTFYTKGVKTPFLSAELDMDIPASMRSQILGKQLHNREEDNSGKTKKLRALIAEGHSLSDIDFNECFSAREDPVMAIINGMKYVDDLNNETADEKKARLAAENEKIKAANSEILKKNLSNFLNMATIVPKLQNIDEVDLHGFWGYGKKPIQEVLTTAAWNDKSLLYDVGVHYNKYNTKTTKNIAKNPAILGINFNFTILGLSAFKIGDTFKLEDIPNRYINGTFQVMSISHELSDGMWETAGTAKMRNI